MRVLAPCLAVWWSLAASGGARDIHVSNVAGDDRSDGAVRSAFLGSGPVRTISKALRLAHRADHVVIAKTDQPYRETLSLIGARHSGSETGPFVIEGNGATLDGSAPVSPASWQNHLGDVYYFHPLRLNYQQLFLNGQPAVRHPAAPAEVTLPSLEPLEWCLSDGKLFFRAETGQMPQEYDAACCALRTGITLYYVHDVVVQDLVIQGFQLDGVSVFDVVDSASLIGLTCRANGRSGVSVGGISRVDLEACSLAGNGEAQLRTEGYSHTHVHASELSSGTSPPVVIQSSLAGTVGVTIDGKPLTNARSRARP